MEVAMETSLARLSAAKERLLSDVRRGTPAEWPRHVEVFLKSVRELPRLPAGAALLACVDLVRELGRLGGPGTAADTEWMIQELEANELRRASPSTVCPAVNELLLRWFAIFEPGALVPATQARRVAEYVDLHYRERITLKRLTAVSGWDGRLLAAMFKATMGVTIRAYIERVRIDAAAGHLRRGDKVESVAASTGWRGRSNFFNAFRRQMGVTPAEYQARWLQPAAVGAGHPTHLSEPKVES
jgi:AraC-like DNA-binding protein